MKRLFLILGEELGLFRLNIQRSNLVGGTLNLDGGTRPPYKGLPQSKILGTPMNWRSPEKNFLKTFLFFGEHLRLCPWSLALASSIPVLGLERFCSRKGCPWPWPRIFFVSLALASSLVSSTPPLVTGYDTTPLIKQNVVIVVCIQVQWRRLGGGPPLVSTF